MRKNTRNWLKLIAAMPVYYLLVYLVFSFFGAYFEELVIDIDRPEKWEYVAGSAPISNAIVWDPVCVGRRRYNYNWLGVFYKPLVMLDRLYWHKTHYTSDPDFYEWIKTVKNWSKL